MGPALLERDCRLAYQLYGTGVYTDPFTGPGNPNGDGIQMNVSGSSLNRSTLQCEPIDLQCGIRGSGAAHDRRPSDTEPLLIFLHLAKTGGVSLSSILQKNICTSNFLRINQDTISTSALGTWAISDVVDAFCRLTDEQMRNLRAAWGHFPGSLSGYLQQNSRLITLIRDPVDRIVSAYYYSKSLLEAKGTPLSVSLEDYVQRKEHYDLGFENYMTRVVSGISELDPLEKNKTTGNSRAVTETDFRCASSRLYDYMLVGLTDRFDETLILLAEDLRWSLADIVYTPCNVTPLRPSLAEIPGHVATQIEKFNVFDRALHQQARQLLDRRITDYQGEFARDLAIFRELNCLYNSGLDANALAEIECQLSTASQRNGALG